MRFGRFTPSAKMMVNELLATESEADYAADTQTSLSVKVNVSTSAMLNVLSEHFGQSRYSFGGEILDDFTADFFAALPEDLRLTLAEKADVLTTEMLAKQGVTGRSSGVLGEIEGDATWRYANYSLRSFDDVRQTLHSKESV